MGDNSTRSGRGIRRRAAALATLVAGALLGACTAPGLLAGGTPGAVRSPTTCGAPSYSCNLPFPTERWLVPDAGTATGWRVEIPTNAIDRAVLDQLGPRDEAAEAVIGADGFSPLTPIAFQLPEQLGNRSVPADGGNVVAVWDASTGARVPIRAEVSNFLTDERGARNIVLAWPRTRFEYGHRIVAALRRGVLAIDGSPASPAPNRDEAPEATRAAFAAVDPGGRWDDQLSVTSFVVRSQRSITGDVDRMAAIVRADDHPVRNLTTMPSLIGGSVAVSGQVRVSDFRSDDWVISRDGTATSRERWVDFLLVLPDRPATPRGAPVVVYGHGITVFKESMLVVSAQNAAKGYATIGIDLPNHGSRAGEGGHILDQVFPWMLGRIESSLLQGELDHLSLVLAISTHLGDLDVLPPAPAGGPGGGDGVADLDTEHVLYEGTSLGGVLGGTFLALTPEVDAAYFQVPGSGIIDTIFHSIIWGIFNTIVPVGAEVGDKHVLTFFAQTLLDRADNTYYLDRIAARRQPMWVTYAVNDGVVPNASTERMLAGLDLPMAGEQFGPIWEPLAANRLPEVPRNGIGFRQVPTSQLFGNPLKPLLSHIEFMHPLSIQALDRWLDGRTAAIAG